MNPFIYEYPVKTFFGVGSVGKHLGTLLRGYGENILLAYGGGSIKKNGIYEELTAILRESGKRVTEFSDIMPNPAYRKVQEGAELVRRHQIDFILAAGGGSVIDCCKIVAAQAKLEQDIWEMEFTKHQYPDIWVPMGAVVTASGTGAEMNNGAVITNEEKKIKAGAKFFQTQAVYDIEHMRKFRELTKDMDCKVMAGIVPLKSPGMAKFMTANVPGIFVPDDQIERLKAAGKGNYVAEGIKMAGEFIKQLKEENLCDGVHIMAIGAEENVPLILDAAGL